MKPAFGQTAASPQVTPAPSGSPAPGAPPRPQYQQPPAQYPPPQYPPPQYPPPQYPPAQYPPAQYPPYQQPYAPPYQPQYAPPPPPPGPPQMVHRARTGLLVGGLVTFGVTWGLAILISSANSDSSTYGCDDQCHAAGKYGWVPVLGPVLAESSASGAWVSMPFAALWSIAEAAGVAMTIVGLIGRDVPEYRSRRYGKLQLVPTIGPSSQGFALRANW